jgi:hypothetical protein
VAPLYTLRFVDDFLKPQVLLDRLLEEKPGTLSLDQEAVRAQRAHELVSWKNNPFPTVPDPQLFWRRKFRSSDESARGGPKLRIRRMPLFPSSSSSSSSTTSAGSQPAVYLYRYRTCVPCRSKGRSLEERPFFGVDAEQVHGAARIVVHGRFAVDYAALPPATKEKLLLWHKDSFVVLPFLPGTRCAMSRSALDAETWQSQNQGDGQGKGSGLWREVLGVRQCYRKAGEGAKLLYNAQAMKFAFFAGEKDAEDKEEAYWRRRYAEDPFGPGFLCL